VCKWSTSNVGSKTQDPDGSDPFIPCYSSDLDWIIILFFIYLDAFRVEKVGGIILQGHFSGRSQFGKLGSRTFRGHFEESNDIFFWVKNFST
jgi:hypothetical protein